MKSPPKSERRGPAGTAPRNSVPAIAPNHKADDTEVATPSQLASTWVQRRFRLPPTIARLIAELAQIGGRLS